MAQQTAQAAKLIATGEGYNFWLIAGEVYRAPIGTPLDTLGHPMGKRWEASYLRWQQFRAVFTWAIDVT